MAVLLYITLVFGYIYEDSDSLLIENDTLTMCGVHQYTLKVHLTDSARLFVRSASGSTDSTGWLILNAPLIVIRDSSSIIGSARGYKGGYTNSHPWGYGPGGGSAGGVSGGGGGGGAYGGNGGVGGDIYGGSGGIAYGDSADTLIEMGSGGGAGRLTVVISNGGSGGASISLQGECVMLDSSTIETNGQNGETGLAGLEGSGAGAGGGVRIWTDTVAMHHVTIDVRGGAGGDAAYGGGGGGSGGRIKIFYTTEIDTSGVAYFVAGGNGGQGNPQFPASSAGDSGSLYIGVFTGINELITQNLPALSIRPNPVRNMVNITIEKFPTTARLYDVSGRLIMKLELLQERERVDLSALRCGIYFMVIENHPSQPGKIVVID
jgi:hypothetical protein